MPAGYAFDVRGALKRTMFLETRISRRRRSRTETEELVVGHMDLPRFSVLQAL
jgi:hypothetical protein